MVTSGLQLWVTRSSTRSKQDSSARQTPHTEYSYWKEQASWRRSGKPLCSWHSSTSKKAFDHVQHSFATAALQHKGVSDQLISILNKWWTQSSVEVSLAGIKSDRRIAFQRGLPQGALESPAIFVAVSDYVWGKLDDGWRNRNIGWKLDNIHLTSIA